MTGVQTCALPIYLLVMELVARGLMNKQIAAGIGISEKTVKEHRGHVTRKMSIRSVAEFVRVGERLGMHVSRHTRT